MKPKLSVIIPVYKVEKYLDRCISSVLEQDFTDLELILVDDGSPDDCPRICDEWAMKDSRVSVIHKVNGGLSSARNAGIKAANGEYVAFLDSDDQWGKGQLNRLMKQIESSGSTMVFFASLCLYDDGSLYLRDDKGLFSIGRFQQSSLSLYPFLIKIGDLHESACTKLVKLDFLKDNNLTFKEGILCEDTEWMFRCLRLNPTIVISPIQLFICTMGRPGSISNTASTKSVLDTLSIIESSIAYYKKNPEGPCRDLELAHCSYLWAIALGLYGGIPQNDRGFVKTKIKILCGSLKLSSHPKAKKVGILYRLCGFNITAYLLNLLINKHRRSIRGKKAQ